MPQTNEFPKRAWIGNILAEFIPYSVSRVIFLFQGLPSIPCDGYFLYYLAERFNATVVYPRYSGTWESKGVFNLKDIYRLFSISSLKDCYTHTTYNFNFKKYFGIGHSFGGMVTLKLLSENKLDAGVALAAPWKLENIDTSHIKTCFGRAYDLKPFSLSISPSDIINKPHLIIHSKDDPIVTYDEVKKYIKGLNVRIVDGYGHGGKKKLIKRYSRTIAKLFKDG